MNLSIFKGKPIEKLITVISKAIGTAYKPTAIRNEADAEAYKIKVIERAKSEAFVESKEIQIDAFERMKTRLIHQETQRQLNIDNVTQIAAEQIQQEDAVSEDPVDEDWATRFFNIVGDISDKEMHILWGRILAGEVKSPKSFSLRTLELLKNLSKDEAILFTKIAPFALKADTDHMLYNPKHLGCSVNPDLGINYTNLLHLKDVGLILSDDNIHFSFDQNYEIVQYGKMALSIKRATAAPIVDIPILMFSKSASELLKLIEPNFHQNYLISVGVALKAKNIIVKYGDYVANPEGVYQLTNEVVIH